MTPRLCPHLLVRVAGVPLERLHELGRPKLLEALEAIGELEGRIDALREPLSEDLYRIVPTLEDPALRHRLLTLRRNLTSIDKLARNRGAGFRALVPAETAERLEALDALSAERDGRAAALEEAFERAARETRAAFRGQVRDENVQRGLLAANELLFRRAQAYAATPGGEMAPGDAKVEDSLVSYFSRAAAKTSPFSTFTYTARAAWTGEAEEVVDLGPAVPVSRIRLNRTALARVVEALARRPEVRPHLHVRLNPTVQADEGEYRFYRQEPRTAPTRAGWINVHETFVRLPWSATLALVVERLAEGGGATLAAFGQEIAVATGTPVEKVSAYLERLAASGLLLLAPPAAELDMEYEHRLAAWLQRIGAEVPAAAAAGLRAALGTLPALEDAPAAARPALAARLAEGFRAAEAAAEVQPFQEVLFFEDAVFQGPALRVSRGDVEVVLDDLHVFAAASSAFDALHLRKARMACCLAERFGAGARVELMRFYEAFLLWTREHGEASDRAPVRAIQSFQRELKQVVTATARHLPDRIVIDPAALREALRGMPEGILPPRSASFFMQKAGRPGAPWKVNLPLEGYGKFFSRFAFLIDGAGAGGDTLTAALRAEVARLCEPDEALADLGGVFGSNVNLHRVHAPFVLGGSGCEAPLAGVETLRLGDLEVALDPAGRPRLCHRPSGRTVMPFHFGFLVKPWLSGLARFLLGFEPPKAKPVPWHELVLDSPHPVGETPRIHFGGLLIYRRQWHVPAAELPSRPPRVSNVAYFAAANEWRRSLGIPAQVFVSIDHRLMTEEEARERPAEARLLDDKFKRKPQFVDFSSPLFLRRIERMMAVTERKLTCEEVYPEWGDPLARGPGGSYATEVVAEVAC